MAKETKEAPKVSTNPALVEFPRDEWGFTTALRKAGLQAASNVRGNAEKHSLFIATIKVLAQHAIARLEDDAVAVEQRIKEIAERDLSHLHRQHWGETEAVAAPVEQPTE